MEQLAKLLLWQLLLLQSKRIGDQHLSCSSLIAPGEDRGLEFTGQSSKCHVSGLVQTYLVLCFWGAGQGKAQMG